MHTRTVTVALAATAMLLAGCASSDTEPEAAKTETVTATATENPPEPLTKEETIQQCTDAVAEAAPGWDDWSLSLEGWQDDPETPEVCTSLDNAAYMGALIEGLDIAAACDTPDALPGRC